MSKKKDLGLENQDAKIADLEKLLEKLTEENRKLAAQVAEPGEKKKATGPSNAFEVALRTAIVTHKNESWRLGPPRPIDTKLYSAAGIK